MGTITDFRLCYRVHTAIGVRFSLGNFTDYLEAVATDQPFPRLSDVLQETRYARWSISASPLFKYPRSRYFISLPEALEVVDPEELEEANYQTSGLSDPRTFSEISDAIDLLIDQIWYNHHKVFQEKIYLGEVTVVAEQRNPADTKTVSKTVLEMSQKRAERVEERRGLENLGPWSNFEWGMLNGKLSALRWVLGDEWDVLDI